MKRSVSRLGILVVVLGGCGGEKKSGNDLIEENIDNGVGEERVEREIMEKCGKIVNGGRINKDGRIE